MPTIEELIDQMVDGGMTPGELRQAIERLDAAPESWRRCALAFLEAQSWADAFRSMDETVTEPVPGVPGELASQSRTAFSQPPIALAAPPRRRWKAAALAAGIAGLAFSLGWLSHGAKMRRDIGRSGPPVLAGNTKTPRTPAVEVVQHDFSAEPLVPGSIPGLPTDRVPTVREVARLRLGSGDRTSAEVPIFAGPGVTPRWLLDQPPPVSEHERAIWQRQGYELEQQRRLLSVPLKDGRRATVPVDHVQVRYVGQVPL